MWEISNLRVLCQSHHHRLERGVRPGTCQHHHRPDAPPEEGPECDEEAGAPSADRPVLFAPCRGRAWPRSGSGS